MAFTEGVGGRTSGRVQGAALPLCWVVWAPAGGAGASGWATSAVLKAPRSRLPAAGPCGLGSPRWWLGSEREPLPRTVQGADGGQPPDGPLNRQM